MSAGSSSPEDGPTQHASPSVIPLDERSRERVGAEVADVDQVFAVRSCSWTISQSSLRSRAVMPDRPSPNDR